MLELTPEFYKEETRQGHHISKEMKSVWAVSMDMAMKLIDVCRRHGLRCFMDSGTLLGAVRHKGFIPWDDDIDFVMLRKDYDQLLKIASDEFQYPYFFQTTYSDKDYYRGHAQLRRQDTTSLSLSELDYGYCKGIDIDIFVLDGYIENPVKRFFHRTYTMLLKKSIRGYLSKPADNKRVGKKLISAFSKLLYKMIDYRRAFRHYENMFRMVDADKCERVSVSAYRYSSHKRIRRRRSYDQMVDMEFEGLLFPAPNDTDDALRCYFGPGYMTPQQLPTAHGEKYMDASTPYPDSEALIRRDPSVFDERVRRLYG
jgi:phosphorylcholine metabolism protein LicD